MAINPSDTNEVWALTGYNDTGSVYKSINAGGTWNNIISGDYLYKLVIHPNNPFVIYVSGSFVIIKTSDGGTNWVDLGITEGCDGLFLDPQNPNRVYGATRITGDSNYLYKSLDGGGNWQSYPIGYNSFSALIVHPNDSNILYAGESSSGVYKSLDGGETWSAINNGIRANIIYDSKVDPNNPDILLAGTMAGLFKKSANGTWTRLYYETVFSIAYDPADSNTIYIGLEYRLGKTSDYGNTWDVIYTPGSPPPHNISSIVVDPQNSNIIYINRHI